MVQTLALVTGGAGDIGRAIVARLLEDHDIVVIADRDLDAAERAAAALGVASAGGRGAAAIALDVTDPASCAAMAGQVRGLGKLMTLVNAAGAAQAESLHATGPDQWAADRALNLDACFTVFKTVEDQLIASRGSVVNIASVNGLGVFGHPAYSAAKAGMIHLTRLIAVEYGHYGVRANSVAPGTVRTQAWEARAANNPAVFREAAAHYVLGRIARPEDVAEAVAFLASSRAAAITGVCLPVDCGLTAGIPALAATFSQSSDYRNSAD
ncbi:SDR family oxidoreductase [Halodurantibacterium flavum]|uniref:SDR family oxidoreductase n=1 Tax=Halodurantibacterium flavum TaxID=1382802 RepID=A0ABW4S0J9_9RHOB